MLDMRLAELVDIVPTLSKIAGHSVNPMLPGLDLLERRKGQVHLQSFMVEGMNKHSHPCVYVEKRAIQTYYIHTNYY